MIRMTIAKAILALNRKLKGIWKQYFLMPYWKEAFKSIGENVYIGDHSSFIFDHVEIGNNVFIGEGASFIAAVATIHIGNHVMFGPHVTIRGGDHRIDIVGRYIDSIDNSEKLPENDQDVYIEDDVWIGCNVTILKGGSYWTRVSGRCWKCCCEKHSALHHSCGFSWNKRISPVFGE